jgi:hypothetical protein
MPRLRASEKLADERCRIAAHRGGLTPESLSDIKLMLAQQAGAVAVTATEVGLPTKFAESIPPSDQHYGLGEDLAE